MYKTKRYTLKKKSFRLCYGALAHLKENALRYAKTLERKKKDIDVLSRRYSFQRKRNKKFLRWRLKLSFFSGKGTQKAQLVLQ